MVVEIFTIPLGFDNCYVLKGDGVVAVDAGQPGKVEQFAAGLAAAGIAPEDVAVVVLSHGHWDHVGSARDIKSLTGAVLTMHRSEIEWLERSLTPLPPGVTAWARAVMPLCALAMPFIEVPSTTVDLPIDDGGLDLGQFGIPGRVLHTPGHSPGSVSVLLDTGEAFVGDLAMNRLPLRLSPGLPIFAEDLPQVVESWKLLLSHGATEVYPAHGRPFPAIVMERAIELAT
jgi:glyoxylase-like metal-dependent hydrolase (beta-lactamase superfamily II)